MKKGNWIIAIAGVFLVAAGLYAFRERPDGQLQEMGLKGEGRHIEAPARNEAAKTGEGSDEQNAGFLALVRLSKSKDQAKSRETLHGAGSVEGERVYGESIGRSSASYKWSPDGKMFLTDYGDKNPVIFYSDGTLLTEVPFPPGATTSWRWLSSSALIGLNCENDYSVDTQFLYPHSVSLFVYMIDKEPHLRRVALPVVPVGEFVQLEGVTADEELVLSVAKAEFYDQGGGDFLGVFKVKF